jgi:tyrosyl-DNA phosphodiesterase 2
MLGPVSRVKLPSKYGRCALSVDIIPHPPHLPPVVSSTFISILLETRSLTVPSRWRSLPTSCASLDAVVD